MAYFKYLVVKVKGNPTPILFYPTLAHKDIFTALVKEKLCAEHPISAGQVSINGRDEFDVIAMGESISLGIDSHPEDAALIKRELDIYNY